MNPSGTNYCCRQRKTITYLGAKLLVSYGHWTHWDGPGVGFGGIFWVTFLGFQREAKGPPKGTLHPTAPHPPISPASSPSSALLPLAEGPLLK